MFLTSRWYRCVTSQNWYRKAHLVFFDYNLLNNKHRTPNPATNYLYILYFYENRLFSLLRIFQTLKIIKTILLRIIKKFFFHQKHFRYYFIYGFIAPNQVRVGKSTGEKTILSHHSKNPSLRTYFINNRNKYRIDTHRVRFM